MVQPGANQLLRKKISQTGRNGGRIRRYRLIVIQLKTFQIIRFQQVRGSVKTIVIMIQLNK